jgi:NNP family nitrate/nitrite transporter-like MFS transporter
LIITTVTLTLSFATWFMMSAVVVRLPGIGFNFTPRQLFWLTAMPGLAGGTLRILHTFLIPIFGTRLVISVATLLKLIPCVGIGLAVMNPDTPFWVFVVLALASGLGGGDFSSYMPSTSMFFPKHLQGTALGIQAGIGNFGVSLAQFVTPWIIGFVIFGGLVGGPQTLTKGAVTKSVWLQNAAFWYVPFLVVFAVLAWFLLRSIPIKASFRQQLDIYGNRHTWIMTSLYIMTFGSFSGFSATFPMLIKELFGKMDNAPDPLAFAFIGPFVGSLVRVLAGPLADKWGGAKLTQISGIGLLACSIGVTFFTAPQGMGEFPFFVAIMLGLFFFSGIGNASTFRQIPVIFEPRQAGGVLGWTAAIAAYGPFVFGLAIGEVLSRTGTPNLFFFGAAAFYAVNIGVNWWYYARKNAVTAC